MGQKKKAPKPRRIAGVGYVRQNRKRGRSPGYTDAVATFIKSAAVLTTGIVSYGCSLTGNIGRYAWNRILRRDESTANLPQSDENTIKGAQDAARNPTQRKRRGDRDEGTTTDCRPRRGKLPKIENYENDENTDITSKEAASNDEMDLWQDDEMDYKDDNSEYLIANEDSTAGVRRPKKEKTTTDASIAQRRMTRSSTRSKKRTTRSIAERRIHAASAIPRRKIRAIKLKKYEKMEDFLNRMEDRNKKNFDERVVNHLVELAKNPKRRNDLFPTIHKDSKSTKWHVENTLSDLGIVNDKSDKKSSKRMRDPHTDRRLRDLIVNDFSSDAALNYRQLSSETFEEGNAHVKFFDATTKQANLEKTFKFPYEHTAETVEEDGYKDNKHWKEGKKVETYCDCEPGTCNAKRCPCMQASIMRNGRVVERLHSGDDDLHAIIECGGRCRCCKNGKCATNTAHFKEADVHIVDQDEMGFGFRVMRMKLPGQLIVDFTGVRQVGVKGKEVSYAYTAANFNAKTGKHAWMRKFSGIKDRDAQSFFINPLRRGNCGRQICHSCTPNAAFVNIYSYGTKYTDPKCGIYAKEIIEPGQYVYLSYGRDYGLTITKCSCTQLLCNSHVKRFLDSISYDEAVDLLTERLNTKAKRVEKLKEAVFAKADSLL